MNTEFKASKGEWRVDDSGYLSQGGGLCIMNGNECIAVVGDYNPHHPIKENAILIADAGNTIQSCGLLPSELLKQRNDMREMLKYLHNVGGQGFEIHDRIEKLIESTEVNP